MCLQERLGPRKEACLLYQLLRPVASLALFALCNKGPQAALLWAPSEIPVLEYLHLAFLCPRALWAFPGLSWACGASWNIT